MPEWEERIVRDTRPATRAEHELRYAAAAPLVRDAPVWADLGCGTGVAAGAAFGDGFAGHAVLVDAAQDALDEAAATVQAGETTALTADLASPDDVARVGAAIRAAGTGGVVTCFEVIEHLETFVPVLELLRDLAEDDDFTVFLSVPNDAFWALENPYHRSMWGEGSFEELRRLLPREHAIAHQVPLSGSAIVPVGADATVDLPPAPVDSERVPSHFLAAFGPRAGGIGTLGRAIASDLDGQRTWERQRESNLAHYEAAAHANNHGRRLPWRRPGAS